MRLVSLLDEIQTGQDLEVAQQERSRRFYRMPRTLEDAVDWEREFGPEELYPGDARLKSAKVQAGCGGLRIVAAYNLSTQRGAEAFSDVSKGIIKQGSVGFMPADDGHTYDSKGVHSISKVGLFPEVSNVLVGASPGRYTAIAKAANAKPPTAEQVAAERLRLLALLDNPVNFNYLVDYIRRELDRLGTRL